MNQRRKRPVALTARQIPLRLALPALIAAAAVLYALPSAASDYPLAQQPAMISVLDGMPSGLSAAGVVHAPMTGAEVRFTDTIQLGQVDLAAIERRIEQGVAAAQEARAQRIAGHLNGLE